jgi:hypothetical protein
MKQCVEIKKVLFFDMVEYQLHLKTVLTGQNIYSNVYSMADEGPFALFGTSLQKSFHSSMVFFFYSNYG